MTETTFLHISTSFTSSTFLVDSYLFYHIHNISFKMYLVLFLMTIKLIEIKSIEITWLVSSCAKGSQLLFISYICFSKYVCWWFQDSYTYLSPCQAGCLGSHQLDNNTWVYTNCSCIDGTARGQKAMQTWVLYILFLMGWTDTSRSVTWW